MTTVYFIRHAEPNYNNHNDAARELTEKGMLDRELVTAYLEDKGVDIVLSSPYKRSVDTVKHFADLHKMTITLIEDFRERQVDSVWIKDFDGFCRKQWQDFSYKLSDGETLAEVQERNIAALKDVLEHFQDKTIVVGSHGTALSTIINYYDSSFRYEDFMKIKTLMPWIVKFIFKGDKLVSIEKINVFDRYAEGELTPRVKLNIDFARANVKSLIYDQAVLEGVSTTFPQIETILENGEVNGVRASDVQKILNLKHAWEFILDPDVIASPCNYYMLSHIARLVNEGFYENGGSVRNVPVTIGGSNYVPPIPIESDVKGRIDKIVDSGDEDIDTAIEIALYCMKSQIFIDGNKRASIIFANHFMIGKGIGLLVVPENLVSDFKGLLVAFYEGRDDNIIKDFLKEKCWRQF